MQIAGIKFPTDQHWANALEVIKIIQAQGFQAFLVGGCVRDILLGLETGDYDISTSAHPDEILKLFPSADKIGYRFGVLKIEHTGFEFQVATFRRDAEAGDGRRPQRIYFTDLTGDARRRDFTINAIYLDPLKKEFLDPVQGMQDLKNKILRLIGDPERRLEEDHLRILRAVRFAARFHLNLEPGTLLALKNSSAKVQRLSPHRIRDELTRTFLEGDRIYALNLLHISGILPILFGNLDWQDQIFLRQLTTRMSELEEVSSEAIWSAFFIPWKHFERGEQMVLECLEKYHFPRTLKKAIKANLT